MANVSDMIEQHLRERNSYDQRKFKQLLTKQDEHYAHGMGVMLEDLLSDDDFKKWSEAYRHFMPEIVGEA